MSRFSVALCLLTLIPSLALARVFFWHKYSFHVPDERGGFNIIRDNSTQDLLTHLGFTNIEKIFSVFWAADLPEGWTVQGDVLFDGGKVNFFDKNGKAVFKQRVRSYINWSWYGDVPTLLYLPQAKKAER